MLMERDALPFGAKVTTGINGLGPYSIDRPLGAGGLAITYLAHDHQTNDKVALKEFFPQDYAVRVASGLGSAVRPAAPDRIQVFEQLKTAFEEEAYKLAELHHPGIVQSFKPFDSNGTSYYSMRYIEGETLSDLLDHRGTLTWDQFRPIFMGVLDALESVHAEGMQHLDISPKNIMLDRQQNPILIDFGNARRALAQGEMSQMSHGSVRVYTKFYAAPEQRDGKGARGPWTDLYSLGAIAFKALSGQKPPEDGFKDLSQVQRAIFAKQTVDAYVVVAIQNCLQLDSAKRTQSVADLRQILDSVGTIGPNEELWGKKRRRHALLALGYGAASVFLTVVLFFFVAFIMSQGR